MTTTAAQNSTCKSEDVAAYLDGELDPAQRPAFEEHLKQCRSCAAELLEQRRLLCTLDLALAEGPGMRLPEDFARLVAVYAGSDMRGVRQRGEHRRALRYAILLAGAAFVLLGRTALRDAVLLPAGIMLKRVWSACECLSHSLYNLGAGLAVIIRALGGHLIFGSRGLGLIAGLMLAAALVLLPHLIRSYHRSQGQFEESRRSASGA